MIHHVALNESGRTMSAEELAEADTELWSDQPAIPSEERARISDNPKDIAARDKVPLQLLPPVAMRLTAQAIAHGSRTKGYGDFNWRQKPIGLMTYIGALMRHTNAIQDGEDIDPESGLPHLAHIAAGACILMDASYHGNMIDNRPEA